MKKIILLLHGALGSREQFNELIKELENDFFVYTFSFSGHGENASSVELFSIELFCEDVLKFIDSHHLKAVNIFGYSMGGYVALYLAKYYPDKVKDIFTLATKFDWNTESAAKETARLDPDVMEKKIPAFTHLLAERHGYQYWKNVVNKTVLMMLEMGKHNPISKTDFSEIKSNVLLGLGDQDNMVSVEETSKIQGYIPKSKFIIFPGTPHPLEKVNGMLLSDEIKLFFSDS